MILGTADYWVGIRRTSVSDPFLMLSTNNQPEFSLLSPQWGTSQPVNTVSDQNCLNSVSASNNLYHNDDCSKNKPFLCEVPGHKSPTRKYIICYTKYIACIILLSLAQRLVIKCLLYFKVRSFHVALC